MTDGDEPRKSGQDPDPKTQTGRPKATREWELCGLWKGLAHSDALGVSNLTIHDKFGDHAVLNAQAIYGHEDI